MGCKEDHCAFPEFRNDLSEEVRPRGILSVRKGLAREERDILGGRGGERVLRGSQSCRIPGTWGRRCQLAKLEREGRPGLDDALGVGLCSVDRGTCQHGTSSVQWEWPALGQGDATRDKGLGRARWAPCTGGGCVLREWREREFEVLEETQTSLKLSSGLC